MALIANTPKPAEERESFEVGDSVEHKTFGVGTVQAVVGDKITIAFKIGTKKLLAGYAPIKKMGD